MRHSYILDLYDRTTLGGGVMGGTKESVQGAPSLIGGIYTQKIVTGLGTRNFFR